MRKLEQILMTALRDKFPPFFSARRREGIDAPSLLLTHDSSVHQQRDA